MIYPDFASFMNEVVAPLRIANPKWERLDGQRSGGNRTIIGHFQHREKVWKVHADSHFGPLQLALDAIIEGSDPFKESETKEGKCLVLNEELRAKYEPKYKHLYIYEVKRL